MVFFLFQNESIWTSNKAVTLSFSKMAKRINDHHLPNKILETNYQKTDEDGHNHLIGLHHYLAGQMLVVEDVMFRIRSGFSIIQLTGLPLVGKSYIAQRVAYDLAQNSLQWFGRTAQIHAINLRRVPPIIRDLRRVVFNSLGCKDEGIPGDLRRLWQVLESVPQMHVFIFENAEIMDMTNELRDEFLTLCTSLSASKNVRLIMTSRIQYQLKRAVSEFHSIEVQPLSIEDSRQLFRFIVGDLGLWEHNLVPLCAGIPHVITTVARAIHEDLYTPEEMQVILKSSRLVAFTINATEHNNMHTELEKCVQKLTGMYLKKKCADLAYIPGTFSAEAAAYITDSVSVAATKHDVIDPLHSVNLILRNNLQGDRFQIHAFVKALIEDRYGFFRDESLIRNRYCKFFAQLLQRLAPLADRSRGQKFHLITQELTNLEKLLQQAVHLIDEHYDLFFDIAYNAEYHIINLMPKKESVDFYEATMNTAKLKDPRQCGILLSSFGQVRDLLYLFFPMRNLVIHFHFA